MDEEFTFINVDGGIQVRTKKMSCRNCRNFVRVKEREECGLAITKRRGFCAIGHGGFSIDAATSDCDDWTYSKYNQETNDLETAIDDFYWKMVQACNDRRSKQYRAMKQYYEALSKDKFWEDKPTWMRFRYFIEEDMARSYTRAIMADKIIELSKRKHMNMREYNKMMFTIRNEIYQKIAPIIEDDCPVAFIDGS